ncbi:phosphotransferase [Plebeiibacterium sediminum]|uniref:Ecdysteroid 22-kinase family protein n=1 Tax=Plebeiibacterium sediminum TaxID=2992112 RepID=A0AAE3M857_9BACT|nr:phosphotransferase [Plebeiobacterium sediminum]MCW3789026.1 ecdysteroid 22-kinase family protein [Plebeiobacterium sediminum]
MDTHFKEITLNATGAKQIIGEEEIQSLWSGYGSIVRIRLAGGNTNSVVAKHVRLPNQNKHPRGWNTDFSHQRKVKSYEVETIWYEKYAAQCNDLCKIPACLALEHKEDEVFMVLQDLDDIGYGGRLSSVSWTEIKSCLKWLANFHATYMGTNPEGLWQIGTYWHLDTRPDELAVLDDIALKNAAALIDDKLNKAQYLTLVHGDAKLANFCFSGDGKKVAAVDFQYVGGGCGMKDVAYFVGSCLYEEDCERLESDILDFYFKELKDAIQMQDSNIDVEDLETEWRNLYYYAWTDFHRFLKGWSPGHWKINDYSEKVSRRVLEEIKNNQ